MLPPSYDGILDKIIKFHKTSFINFSQIQLIRSFLCEVVWTQVVEYIHAKIHNKNFLEEMKKWFFIRLSGGLAQTEDWS